MKKTSYTLIIYVLIIFAACTSSQVGLVDGQSQNDTATPVADQNTSQPDTNTGVEDKSTVQQDTNVTTKDTHTGTEDTGGLVEDLWLPEKAPCSDLSKLDPTKRKIGQPCTDHAQCQTGNCMNEGWVNKTRFCTARCQGCDGDNGVCAKWPSGTGLENKCVILKSTGANQSAYKAFCIAQCGGPSASPAVSKCEGLNDKLGSAVKWACKKESEINDLITGIYNICYVSN